MENKRLQEKAAASWEGFKDARRESAKNLLNLKNERDTYLQIRDTYLQINKLLDTFEIAISYSENQYMEKDGLYTPLFNTSMRFEDSNSAKLYDVLFQFFGGNNAENEILTIIGMVQSYAEKSD